MLSCSCGNGLSGICAVSVVGEGGGQQIRRLKRIAVLARAPHTTSFKRRAASAKPTPLMVIVYSPQQLTIS